MKVLIFHQFFGTSEDVGAGTRTYELGRRLVRRGDSVTIVTGNWMYFSGEKVARTWFLWSREDIEGIEVLRVNIPFGGSHSLLPRMIGFLWFIPVGLLAALCASRPEVVVATSTPLTIGIPGYLLSRLRGVPFVLELRDLWPDCVVDWDVVHSRFLIGAAYWLESFLYRNAQRIITVTEGIRQQLINKGVNPKKICVITNASDIELFTPEGRRADLKAAARVPDGSFVCIHSGSLGMANCVEFLLDVADNLRKTAVHLVILGAGSRKTKLVAEAARRGLNGVHFLEPVPKTEVPPFLRSADLGIAAFRPGALTHIFLPNKFFDYLACGLPVMVNFDGEARRHLETSNAGLYGPPDDARAFAKAIQDLAASPERRRTMAGNARKLSEKYFGWDHKSVEFRDALSAVFKDRTPVLGRVAQT